jgi:hypothetical protein
MSHNCYSIAVKHAFTSYKPSNQGEPDWEQIVEGIDYWAEMQEDAVHPAVWTPPTWYVNGLDAELGCGWVVKKSLNSWESAVDIKNGNQEVYACPIRKGDKLVYGLNSSQYSNVGEVEMTYFADDENHLQDFLNDFFPGSSCEDNVAIQQWM